MGLAWFATTKIRLENRNHLHFEDKYRVRRYVVARTAGAVGQIRRSDQPSPSAHAHSQNAVLPRTNHLELSERDRDLTRVELLSVWQPAGVSNHHAPAPNRDGSRAHLEVLHVQTRRTLAHRAEVHAERWRKRGAFDVALDRDGLRRRRNRGRSATAREGAEQQNRERRGAKP